MIGVADNGQLAPLRPPPRAASISPLLHRHGRRGRCTVQLDRSAMTCWPPWLEMLDWHRARPERGFDSARRLAPIKAKPANHKTKLARRANLHVLDHKHPCINACHARALPRTYVHTEIPARSFRQNTCTPVHQLALALSKERMEVRTYTHDAGWSGIVDLQSCSDECIAWNP